MLILLISKSEVKTCLLLSDEVLNVPKGLLYFPSLFIGKICPLFNFISFINSIIYKQRIEITGNFYFWNLVTNVFTTNIKHLFDKVTGKDNIINIEKMYGRKYFYFKW